MIQTVYIDDCCKLRAKIASVFGESVTVKLDLFHAVQLITNMLHKRHPLLQQCMQDLQLVYQQDGDGGVTRMAATPSPEVILSKMNKFVDKWKDVQGSSTMHVFTSETIPAIDRLNYHISSGCISNVPPGGGTNRKECFQHHIHSLFNRSKMGILLAYALLTVVMYLHNSSKKIHGQVVSRLITASSFRRHQTGSSKWGHAKNTRGTGVCHSDYWEVDSSQNIMDMQLIVPTHLRSL